MNVLILKNPLEENVFCSNDSNVFSLFLLSDVETANDSNTQTSSVGQIYIWT